MSNTLKFQSSAIAAVEWAESLLALSQQNGFAATSSSLLDIMTICRQTGVELPELDFYAKSRQNNPTLLLCGGDYDFARRVASCIGYTLQESDCIGEETLIVDSQKGVQTEWKFQWTPEPSILDPIINTSAGIEFLLEQKACVFVVGDTVTPLLKNLREAAQKLWEIPVTECENPEYLKRFFSELNTLLADSKEHIQMRETAQWNWFSEKLLEKIAKMRLHFHTQLDKLGSKNKLAKYMLDEFRTNWVNGARNHIDSYINNRTNSPAFAQFLDLKGQGPSTSTYMNALSTALLKSKLETHMTHRMAEFVAGLGALAIKIELRQIVIGEIYTAFSFEKIPAKIENYLNEKKVFPEGGNKKVSTFKALTGKSQAAMDERKGQIAKANRLVAQLVEAEFVEWCKGFMSAVEGQVRLQLAAGLANQDLPDAEGLQNRIDGLDRISQTLKGEEQSTPQANETSVHGWLDVLAMQQLIPRYQIQ